MNRRECLGLISLCCICPTGIVKKPPQLNQVLKRIEDEGSYPFWRKCRMRDLVKGDLVSIREPKTNAVIVEGFVLSAPYIESNGSWAVSLST